MLLEGHSASLRPTDDIVGAMADFIKANVGYLLEVFHEIASDDLHIDVYHARMAGDIRCQWLLTFGMSRKPMKTPPGCESGSYAELAIALLADWPLNLQSFKDEDNYWPVRLLKMLARYPHENNTWLFAGHPVSLGRPFARSTNMSSVVLTQPRLLGADPALRVRDHDVLLWGVCPIYGEELAYKDSHGFASLAKLLGKE